jgi:hypothetical protein
MRIRNPTGQDATKKDEQTVHRAALKHIAEYVQEILINNAQAERMTMLRETYQQHMLENAPGFFTENFKNPQTKMRNSRKNSARSYNFGSQITKVSLYTQLLC